MVNKVFDAKELRVIRLFDPWRSPLCTCPIKYSLHPYTGCSHYCLYCYASSYIGRKPSIVKKDLLKNISSDLRKLGNDQIIELSTSSDPYPPIEKDLEVTRSVLKLLLNYNVKLLITTKSDLVVRDIDVLSRTRSAVMITITTLDDKISTILEPGAPLPRQRIYAVKALSKSGIPVGVRIDPVIPFINDDPHMMGEIIAYVKEAGAQHVVTSTYKAKWDSLARLQNSFPEIASKLREYYVSKGSRIHGYMYLPKDLRRSMLEPIVKMCMRYGLTVATCREGLGNEFFNAPSCDGSHLIGKQPCALHR
ncbi:MAG: radical SAM protein [Desulfurococcaceae archaeon]